MELNAERFDQSLRVLVKFLGPELTTRFQSGLTPGQVFLLLFVQQNSNRCTVSKLAETLDVAPSAVTVMLDRLEDHGYVSRMRDQTDRRVVVTALTDSGKEKLNHVIAVRRRVINHCLSQLDGKELDAFIRTLESLTSIAQEMDVDALVESPDVPMD